MAPFRIPKRDYTATEENRVSASSPPTPSAPLLPAFRPVLRAWNQRKLWATWPLDSRRSYTLGRQNVMTRVDLAFAEDAPNVSRRHARLVCGLDRAGCHTFLLRDLQSAHGTFVARMGDAHIRSRLREGEEYALEHGDVIWLGKVCSLVFSSRGAEALDAMCAARKVAHAHFARGGDALLAVAEMPVRADVDDASSKSDDDEDEDGGDSRRWPAPARDHVSGGVTDKCARELRRICDTLGEMHDRASVCAAIVHKNEVEIWSWTDLHESLRTQRAALSIVAAQLREATQGLAEPHTRALASKAERKLLSVQRMIQDSFAHASTREQAAKRARTTSLNARSPPEWSSHR